jgi:hypothetical protein
MTDDRTAASYREDITGLIRKCDDLTRERDEARAERDKLADVARHLGRIVSSQSRATYAAWIDSRRGDHKAAAEWLANSVPDVPDHEPWNGTETGGEWFWRTKEQS